MKQNETFSTFVGDYQLSDKNKMNFDDLFSLSLFLSVGHRFFPV